MNDEGKAQQEFIHTLEKMRLQLDEIKKSAPEIGHAQDARQTPEIRYGRLFEIAETIAEIVETKEPYKEFHHLRVADLACAIGTEMNLSDNRIRGLHLGGIIHDIGKMFVPSEILVKPTKLTETEAEQLQTHVRAGYDILKNFYFPWPVARMVLEHHERINGSGYPGGLTGDNLLMESRILAVADVVEAIASPRPYRPGRGIDVSLYDLKGNRNILYDPEAVDVCICLFKEKGYKLIKDE
jgi:HD-GYP domain-containing protein (c-di-GMP phosphodiesterase class II)